MKVLFVCTGNTCRSPMAEGYLRSKNLPCVEVKSRGLAADGSPVSQNSVTAMAEAGIGIENHISKVISAKDIAWADKIICLSPSHKNLLEDFVGEKSRLFVLGQGGIYDPFGGDIEIYRVCRNQIFSAIDSLIDSGEFEEFRVIEAIEAHAEQIADLEKICFSEPWSQNVIVDAMNHGTLFFVGVKGEKLLGYVGISIILDEGYITNIAVFPEFRKKGVASALLKAVFSVAEQKNLSFVSLEVRESNTAAISLYEKTGFKKAGLRKDFYRDPKENALILTKEF